jgi:ribonucleotide monophosphatase NagD (HAD superfamily)
MIGDNLNTDILVAKNAGIDSYCVLTGVTSE